MSQGWQIALSSMGRGVPLLRLRSPAPKAVGIVNLLLQYFKNVTDIHLEQVAVQQQMKEIYFLETKKASVLKRLNAFEPATCRTARTLFAPNYSATVKSSILNFFLHYCTLFARSAREDIWRFVHTFSKICINLAALGTRNALWSVESIFEISLHAALLIHVQHTRTQKKCFPCLTQG